jgi:carbonic anhydrase/acetyltransferase-like protein (isoleucine patch superfamily)
MNAVIMDNAMIGESSIVAASVRQGRDGDPAARWSPACRPR